MSATLILRNYIQFVLKGTQLTFCETKNLCLDIFFTEWHFTLWSSSMMTELFTIGCHRDSSERVCLHRPPWWYWVQIWCILFLYLNLSLHTMLGLLANTSSSCNVNRGQITDVHQFTGRTQLHYDTYYMNLLCNHCWNQ